MIFWDGFFLIGIDIKEEMDTESDITSSTTLVKYVPIKEEYEHVEYLEFEEMPEGSITLL